MGLCLLIFVLSMMRCQTTAMIPRDSPIYDSWTEYEDEGKSSTPCCPSKNENSSQPNYVVNVNVKSPQNELILLLWKEMNTIKHQLESLIDTNKKQAESLNKFNESLSKAIVKSIDDTKKPQDSGTIQILLSSRNHLTRPWIWKKQDDALTRGIANFID